MRDKPGLQALLEVQESFGLPHPALVEKDWLAVRALAAIAAVRHGSFRLVFGGGTALARAHRLISRMSEDIDLKIVGVERPDRPALRALRQTVSNALLAAGFVFDSDNRDHCDSANQSRYTVWNLPYVPTAQGQGALRPALKIEMALWPLRQDPIMLPVSSFIAEAHRRPPELAAIECVSVEQIAAEKFVALTRRTMLEADSVPQNRDHTLVRHIYDLHMILPRCDAGVVATLAATIMPDDADIFGGKHQAYRDDPLEQTRRAIALLETDSWHRQTFEAFARDMIYGEVPSYNDAVASVRAVLVRLPN